MMTRVTPLDVALMLVAYPLLFAARLMVSWLSFSTYSKWLGRFSDTAPSSDDATEAETIRLARRIGSSVSRASRLAFWRADCLPQALVTCFMLRRAGIAHFATIGATLDEDHEQKLHAHAWVTVGSEIVCGIDQSIGHSPLAYYRSARP